ncbi:hypothetical protein QFZ41_003237 [Luteibacter sp. W1I16]|uniref:hypothetical protein n=1 Tax=Luteibacter sp. W1I16 TaxID=3373922 RepID=UPI003D2098A2
MKPLLSLATTSLVACLAYSSLASADVSEFRRLRDAIAASPILTTFQKVAKYAYPPEWDQIITRFAPVDGSCSAETSARLAAMSKSEARRFVDEHSVLGHFVVRGSADSSVGKPLGVVLLFPMDFSKTIKEGETLNLTSLAKTPITVRIVNGEVLVGGYKVDRENSVNTDEGAIIAIDGCEALH